MSDTLIYRLTCKKCSHVWRVTRRAVNVNADTTLCRCPGCGAKAPTVQKERISKTRRAS